MKHEWSINLTFLNVDPPIFLIDDVCNELVYGSFDVLLSIKAKNERLFLGTEVKNGEASNILKTNPNIKRCCKVPESAGEN
jgi:hypothetical protein